MSSWLYPAFSRNSLTRDPNPLKNLISFPTQLVVKETACKDHVLFSTWYNRSPLEDLQSTIGSRLGKKQGHPEDVLCIKPKGMMEE